jgi:hypothetical protein
MRLDMERTIRPEEPIDQIRDNKYTACGRKSVRKSAFGNEP